MNYFRKVLTYFIPVILLFSVSCSEKKNHTTSDKLKVLSTTTIVGDIVSNIADDKAVLTVLLPPGASPHSFEPSPKDAAKAFHADLIFMNGAGLEQFMDKLIQNSGSDAEVISLSDSINLRAFTDKTATDNDGSGHHIEYDPHAWTDPNNVIQWVDVIVEYLSKTDSLNTAYYHQNGVLYKEKLKELDHWVLEQVDQIPEEKRRLITDHMIFGYFCSRYGLEQTGTIISGFSTLSEPSAQDMARLEDTIRKLKVKAILVGNTINPAMAERIAGDTGTRLYSFYTGSLSEQGGPADTYIKYMRYNVDVIAKALQ